MNAQTLDVSPDEMLIMLLLLNQFIDRQQEALRTATSANDSEQARARIEIASRLRGKLPLVVRFNEAISVEQSEPDEQ